MALPFDHIIRQGNFIPYGAFPLYLCKIGFWKLWQGSIKWLWNIMPTIKVLFTMYLN